MVASHIFWTCASARRHWDRLRERWRWIGDIPADYLNVWVLGLDLSGISHYAWDAVKQSFDSSENLSTALATALPSARALLRSAVSTILHFIRVERLRRMEDSSLSQEMHTTNATTIFRQ